ncbi:MULTISPECIES: hypothetical protein [unclassified Methanoculleus]|uniref:hypothetical protein n=1 Tax=unclassified Methanoculleus TaxID=2619537 RepID=UPI0025D96C7D|nr:MULTISPECIES: hypothetical protein [unclassified Methanoculleus]
MKGKNRTRNVGQTVGILITLCIFGAMLVPMASAYGNGEYASLDTSDLSEEDYYRELISNLIGKDITYAEFYEAVYPGEMEKLPEDLQNLYKSSKIQWTAPEGQMPEPLTEEEMSEIRSRASDSKSSLNKVPSAKESVAVLRSLVNNNAASDPIHVSIAGNSWAYHGNRIVEYYSSTHLSPEVRMPYMSVKTRLFMFVEPAWVEIAYKEKTAVLPLSLTVMGEKSVDGGYFYQVLGDHYEIPPPGYVIIGPNPAYSTSQVFYVS